MDATMYTLPPQALPRPSVADFHAWLKYQLGLWHAWAAGRDGSWLALPTGNPTFPSLGVMFAHAFTPLHRYADQLLGTEPVSPPDFSSSDWPALHAWADRCLMRYHQACLALGSGDPGRMVSLKTRSSGVFTARFDLALAHAATHCFWHLAGLAHLLRADGIEPPQHSDLIFWAAMQQR